MNMYGETDSQYLKRNRIPSASFKKHLHRLQCIFFKLTLCLYFLSLMLFLKFMNVNAKNISKYYINYYLSL